MRDRRRAPPEKLKAARAADTEQITAMLVEALERSGYIKPLTAARRRPRCAAWCGG
jgi:restriction endonuclease Mrr